MNTDIKPEDDYFRMKAARKFAKWHLGDASWADQILGAYWAPEAAKERLQLEEGRR